MICSKNAATKWLANTLLLLFVGVFFTNCKHMKKSIPAQIIESNPLEIPPIEELDILRNQNE